MRPTRLGVAILLLLGLAILARFTSTNSMASHPAQPATIPALSQ